MREGNALPDIPERYSPLFRVGQSVNGFDPVGGNQAHAAAGFQRHHRRDHRRHRCARQRPSTSPSTSGCRTTTGSKWSEALKRAAARKVTCRAMADGLGSRTLIDSEHWKAMQVGGRAGRHRPADRESGPASAARPHRPAQPPQDRGDRQPHHLLRQPELRGPGIPASRRSTRRGWTS